MYPPFSVRRHCFQIKSPQFIFIDMVSVAIGIVSGRWGQAPNREFCNFALINHVSITRTRNAMIGTRKIWTFKLQREAQNLRLSDRNTEMIPFSAATMALCCFHLVFQCLQLRRSKGGQLTKSQTNLCMCGWQKDLPLLQEAASSCLTAGCTSCAETEAN